MDLAALRGSLLTSQALEAAVLAGRFAWGDVESIAEFITITATPEAPVVAGEACSTQPGTGPWAGFTTTRTEVAR